VKCPAKRPVCPLGQYATFNDSCAQRPLEKYTLGRQETACLDCPVGVRSIRPDFCDWNTCNTFNGCNCYSCSDPFTTSERQTIVHEGYGCEMRENQYWILYTSYTTWIYLQGRG
jgi:hypothetical protein